MEKPHPAAKDLAALLAQLEDQLARPTVQWRKSKNLAPADQAYYRNIRALLVAQGRKILKPNERKTTRSGR